MLNLVALLLSFVISAHRITLTLHPSPEAKLVDVEIGNDDYYRVSSFYTDGANCRKSHCAVELRDLPSGELALWVTEKDSTGAIINIDKRSFYIR